MLKNISCFKRINILGFLLLAAAVSSKNHVNQANDLVEVINKNRTSKRLPLLDNSPGLACIALQYIKECRANCSENNTVHCKPSENDFTETPRKPSHRHSSTVTELYAIIHNKTHTEVGVGIVRAKSHKGPYLWCALFSSNERNSTFVLEDLGKGIEQKEGCYSGSGVSCSSGGRNGSSIFAIKCVWTLVFCFLVLCRIGLF
ncbi:hypothetical protein SSX86_026992 [Deinandra increscens subsp. villosa]|uniref:Uncharacterized protein n=1 Tax=Deinandra increscens subsp. villosa TaxID=3103831 RepID=A0AAP0GQN9_9ASTR